MEEEAVYTNYLTISWFFRPPPINGVQQHRIPAESKEAAQEMQRKHRRDREDGIIGGRGYTVKTWMPVYNQAVVDQGTAQDSTVEVYEQKDRLYISPYLGNLAISDVTTARVRQWFARDLVGKDGKLLSFNTRKNCFALLSAAFNLAVNEDLIRKNPCDGVKLVRPEGEDEYRGYAFNPGECARLLAAAEGYWNYAIVYTALATGMRECELIGLRWNNVTLTGSRPHIRVIEQYKIVRGKGR